MSHDAHHDHAEPPVQATFIGWFAAAMLVLMAVFALLVLGAGFMG